MPRIDKVAFFGDSYCFDTITKKQKNGTEVFYYPASETYLDIFANKIGADICIMEHLGTDLTGWCMSYAHGFLLKVNNTLMKHILFFCGATSQEK